jgi:hypothetical protein
VYVFDPYDSFYDRYTDENVATVMKVGRVAIITRGRFAGKKVRQSLFPPRRRRGRRSIRREERARNADSKR